MSDKTTRIFGKTMIRKTGITTSQATGDDGEYQAGCLVNPRFVDNGDGTITDRSTGLMWIKTMMAVIPGAKDVTSNNLVQLDPTTGAIPNGANWANNTAYKKGDVISAIVWETGTRTASRAGTIITADAAVFTASDIGKEVFLGGVSKGVIVKYTDSTHVVVGATGTVASTTLALKDAYVCAVDHTSAAAGTFGADLTANPTYWRELPFSSTGAISLGIPYLANFQAMWSYCVDAVNNLDFAGYTDWRLPNQFEMMSLAKIDVTSGFFFGFASTTLWSSTAVSATNALACKPSSSVPMAEATNYQMTQALNFIAVRGGKL